MGLLMEILLFVLISAYLFYRLWMVLGQETDEDLERRERHRRTIDQDENDGDNVISLDQKRKSTVLGENEEDLEFDLKSGAKEGLRQLRLQAPDFSLKDFLQGASSAYQMIIEAYSNGDLKTLKGLLTEKVYEQFAKAIEEQNAEGSVTKTKLERIERSDIEKIEIVESSARITVRFRSRQIITVQKSNGEIIDNPAEISIPITDIWTFTKDLNDSNPNWYLKATASESYRD
jgi:predicted lipid-binding transport protein (Tim44 family)